MVNNHWLRPSLGDSNAILNTICLLKRSVKVIFCGVLSVIVIIANVTVIVVYLKKMRIQTSQTFYKISLALSDIFTGIVMFPNLIFELAALVWKPADQSALSITEVHRSNEENDITYKAISNIKSFFLSKFSTSYLNFLGFFIVITIAESWL